MTYRDGDLFDAIYPEGYRRPPKPSGVLSPDDNAHRPPLAPPQSARPTDTVIPARPILAERIYRPAFISPLDAANPIDRLQVVQVSNASDSDLAKVEQAIGWLNRKSPKARATIDAQNRSGVRININRDDGTQFHTTLDPADRTYRIIDWDPELQARLVDNAKNPTDEYQSPALGLGHEYDHASRQHPDMSHDPVYETNEERKVIEGWETPVAQDLGEPTRTNHYGLPYRTDDPTFISPGILDWDHLDTGWRNYFLVHPEQAGRVRGGPLGGR